MAEENQFRQNIQADRNSVEVGRVDIGGNLDGNLIIGSGNTVGYSPEQVFQLIKQISNTFQAKPFDGTCPYKGLDYFEEKDAELFFGREKLVKVLVGKVKDSRTVFITGPSGSGKSSLVRAGLIHTLKQGRVKGSENWLYATMKPGRDPIHALARAVAGLVMSTNAEDEIRAKAPSDASIFARWCEIALKDGRDKKLVLFIDQFEEVFTQVNHEDERTAFLNLLTHAADAENGRVILLFAMRSDFVPNCAMYPNLNAALNRQFIQIGSMMPEELVSAIAQPALRVGLKIEPELVAQIINDMKGEPGTLPLMSFALKDLFDKEQVKGGMIALTLNRYFENKGINEALQHHADAALAQLNEHERKLAQSIFSNLIEIGRGTLDTKRTAVFNELVPADSEPDEVKAVLQRLEDARLVTTEEGSNKYTITHEKLIDAWSWLKKLINENRDAIALQNEITSAAKEWKENKRDASYLYSGGRLANILEQVQKQKLALGQLAQEFVEVGRRRQQRTRVSLISAVSLVLIAAIIASLVFQNQAQENFEIANTAQAASAFAIQQEEAAKENAEKAEMQAQISRIGELSAQAVSLREKNFLLSQLISVEMLKKTDGLPISLQVRSTLLVNTQTNPQLLQFLSVHSGVFTSALSLDGKILASESGKNSIELWDMETRQPIGEPLSGHSDGVTSIAFSPNGKILASGSWDDTIILWDMETRQPIGEPLRGHSDNISSVAFSPDGKILASGSWDDTIILWDVETRLPIGEPLNRYSSIVTSVAFSPDGKVLVSGSYKNAIVFWDVETQKPIGEPLRGHPNGVTSIVFSPDGKILASGGLDDNIILWNVETRLPIGKPLNRHSSNITSVAFSPDGKTLASGSQDKTIILWDVKTQLPIGDPLRGHSSDVTNVVFSPDGKILVTASYDNTIILWDVKIHQPIGETLRGHLKEVTSVAFSPDGKILASGGDDNTVIMWDVETRLPIGEPLSGHSDGVTSVAFSPDGKILASGSEDNTVILWDVETSLLIAQLENLSNVTSVAFSPDGKILASGSEDDNIILWDMKTRQPEINEILEISGGSLSIAFSPDGKILVAGSYDNAINTITLWDIETHLPIDQPLSGHFNSVNEVAFSPDGKILASGSWDDTIILWDVETRLPIGQPLSGHSGPVYGVAFSPDGKIIASGSWDDTIILWDVETRLPIGEPLSGHSDGITSIAFSPDGKALVSASDDNTIILWDVDPYSWSQTACQRAGRNFTLAEWEQYFPNEDYRKTCEQWTLEPEVVTAPTVIP